MTENVTTDIFGEPIEDENVEESNNVDDVDMDEMAEDDPWDQLLSTVEENLNDRFLIEREVFIKEGSSEALADVKSHNKLLPLMRRHLRETYLKYLLWNRQVKMDETHQKVIGTLNRLRDEEDDMDIPEAAEAAVERRKFLINRKIQPLPLPDEDKDDEDEESDGTISPTETETDGTATDETTEVAPDEIDDELEMKAKTQGI